MFRRAPSPVMRPRNTPDGQITAAATNPGSGSPAAARRPRSPAIATDATTATEEAEATPPERDVRHGVGAPTATTEVTAARYTGALAEILLADPVLSDHAAFATAFEPDEALAAAGAYDWVADLAPKRWEVWVAAYQKMDDKGASVLGWVSGGTGVLAAALTFAVADHKISPWLAVFFLPSIGLAVAACLCAIRSRKGQQFIPPPSVRECLDWVESRGERARVAILAEWNLAITGVMNACSRRARSLEGGLRYGGWAVAALALPVAVAIIRALAYPPGCK